MDDASILLLENGKDEDVHKILREFNTEHERTSSFPELSIGERRQRLWSALFQKLSDPAFSKCYFVCLEAVRILSRDKTSLNDILSREMFAIMVRFAGLVSDEEALSISSKQDDTLVMVEAQKSMCNLIYNSTTAQRICCNNGCVEGIVVRMKTYKEPDLPHEVKFFDMRMLFLLTALCADIRPKLRNELHGLTYLVEILDLILKSCSERQGSAPGFHHRSFRRGNLGRGATKKDENPCLEDNEVALACEVLKILFNLTVHVDKNNLDEEEEAHFLRLVSILHDILICPTQTTEKREELQSHTVNLLTNMPPDCYEELLTPQTEVAGSDDELGKDYEYDGHNMEAIVAMLDFLINRLDKPDANLKETLSPILHALSECARANRTIRKFLRLKVLPPLRDVYNRPEQGDTIRNKLCRLLTSLATEVKHLVADFLFILCKENVARMIKYTGYGNAAGLLATRGLMLGNRGKGNYSSESEDSETEEYREAKDRINPIIGCYEKPHPDPMAGMSDEQKEYEAIQLVNMMEKLSSDGMFAPMTVGADGRLRRMEHILELQEGIEPQLTRHNYDDSSDSN